MIVVVVVKAPVMMLPCWTHTNHVSHTRATAHHPAYPTYLVPASNPGWRPLFPPLLFFFFLSFPFSVLFSVIPGACCKQPSSVAFFQGSITKVPHAAQPPPVSGPMERHCSKVVRKFAHRHLEKVPKQGIVPCNLQCACSAAMCRTREGWGVVCYVPNTC